uniref:H(+)-exporting diphosphatase n=1 Tax=Spongospora subterranea TaxID=70186 RepID=A0A0H5RK40_9EUKA|eukprot:CRZ09094.1 hypothetical protein [Spongospora subterranea]
MFDNWTLLEVISTSLAGGLVSALFAIIYAYQVLTIKIDKTRYPKAYTAYIKIQEGAQAFLKAEFTLIFGFVIIVALGLLIVGWQTSLSFVIGAFLSAATGYLGMSIAVRANFRTTLACAGPNPLSTGLRVAFKSGAVIGLTVVATGILGVSLLFCVFYSLTKYDAHIAWRWMSGFAVGASSIALFARVGGGIYTKAADVGADLVGKVEAGLEEDDPNNPATIADNVGDNVGDVAGMGSDLFESFVGTIIAAGTLSRSFVESEFVREFGVYEELTAAAFPLWISGLGAICAVVGTMLIRTSSKVTPPRPPAPGADEMAQFQHEELLRKHNENVLGSLLGSMRIGVYGASAMVLGTSILVTYVTFGLNGLGWRLYSCIVVGVIVGNLIGYCTEYATSYTYWPTQSIARKSDTGPATVIIQGLGVGMLSCIPPVLSIVAGILAANALAGVYGIAIAGVGMLSTLSVSLAADAFGPVCDNAGGIAEMAEEEFNDSVRETTDALDALGNTTAATGKGFAIGSAVLAAVALMAAFANEANLAAQSVSLLDPVVFPGILLGALMPFVFAALTMLSVGKAAESIMWEVRRQIHDENILNGGVADHTQCVMIATNASLREMVPPGVIAVFAPVIVGFGLGSKGLLGMLVGTIASGFLLAVTMSNAGGSWDNAKKFVEKGNLNGPGVFKGKKTSNHDAVVVGDTVGDPFKDTSGPALNLLIKLMCVVSLVLADKFSETPWAHWRIAAVAAAILMASLFVLFFFMVHFSRREQNARQVTLEERRQRQKVVDVPSDIVINGHGIEMSPPVDA